MMRTNIEIDDALMREVLVQTRAQAKIRRLRGKVRWQDDLETSRGGHRSEDTALEPRAR